MDTQCSAQVVASTKTIFDGTEKHTYYKHWSAIQGNAASRTSTLRGFTEKITTLKLGDKKCSLPCDRSSLLYSLPLVRNVFANAHGLLITM